jgi:predicted peptidase
MLLRFIHFNKGIVAVLFLCFNYINVSAQFQPEIFKSKQGEVMPYQLLKPINFSPNINYPLVIILHGAGERGDDNISQLSHGSSLFLDSNIRKRFPAFVLFPQCPEGKYWATVLSREGPNKFVYSATPDSNLVLDVLTDLLSDLDSLYHFDKNRMYIGGLSMGGMGTFEMVYRNPQKFAAAFAICGGANPAIAKSMNYTPFRIDHGEVDDVVPFILSKKMVDALRDSGAEVIWNLHPGVNHNAWDTVFSDPELLPWLFNHSKK